jgi:DNA-binding response OmpR family regulator
MKSILLIEDERNVAAFIRKGLEEEHYEVIVAHEGQAGLDLLTDRRVDLIILDLILPGMSGFDICRTIREDLQKETPILMLTALGTTGNIVRGLNAGADDYLTKPFKFQELLARIKALFRRTYRTGQTRDVIQIADLELDRDAKIARRKGVDIHLTATEYRLLEYFMINQRKVLSRIDLLEKVWGINFNMGTNVVDVYVNYLRNKIDKPFEPRLIHTVIGMGYIMKE